jgi:hypothetical protein
LTNPHQGRHVARARAQHRIQREILNWCDFEKTGTGTFIMHHPTANRPYASAVGTVKVASEDCIAALNLRRID